ncbi:MAG TPA: phosphoenolpyruvate--protein phosphotransferase [Candidatus Limnocylindria bacterium]|nr:phosphoenolpyruvate--protein phosphotransferase [Candidatus Limnocylindria bacterium]
MSASLRGVPAAPGIGLAPPWVYRPQAGGDEVVPLDEAAAMAADQLGRLAQRLRDAGRESEAGILEAQAMMAGDPELIDAARRAIESGTGAADAILAAGEQQAAVLAALDDELLAARAADVRDVAERIARIIRGQAIPALEHRSVAIAPDLPPSVTAELEASLLAGIALEGGSPTAHAAILARALGIPAVVGVTGLLAAAEGAELIGVDGSTGEVVVDPDAEARARLEAAVEGARELAAANFALRETPLATADGHRVMIAANIGRPEEASGAAEAGAEGVGLFRTEFMFMGRTSAPSVDEQADAYLAAMEPFAGRPFVVRTLDIGGDKELPFLRRQPEENPFLGVRAVRLAAGNRELLVTQLRAILAAAERTEAEPWVMAPMVADLSDVELVRDLLAEAADGKPMPAIRIGIMVEVPSAALVADQLAAAVDFFSIGTNDLTQYLLAADRTNPALAGRQDPMHPAVLRAVRSVVEGGHGTGIPVAVCGEMAGDPVGALALVGLGVDELSMDPHSFGAVKRALASVRLDECRAAATRACEMRSAREAREAVAALLAPAGAVA